MCFCICLLVACILRVFAYMLLVFACMLFVVCLYFVFIWLVFDCILLVFAYMLLVFACFLIAFRVYVGGICLHLLPPFFGVLLGVPGDALSGFRHFSRLYFQALCMILEASILILFDHLWGTPLFGLLLGVPGAGGAWVARTGWVVD